MATFKCPTCGQEFPSEEVLASHHDKLHSASAQNAAIAPATEAATAGGSSPQPAPRRRFRIGTLLRVGIPLIIVGSIAAGALGIFDKKTVDENPQSIAYKFVHQMKDQGTIDEYRAVEPDSGWDYQYELNGDEANTIRVRGTVGTEDLEFSAGDDLKPAIEAEAAALGFKPQ
jgi:hypothetical protein